jgi:hypothetical protein
VPNDVSEEHIASIFRIEEITSARHEGASRWQAEICENLKFYNPNIFIHSLNKGFAT